MLDRYSFIKDYSLLSKDIHQGIFSFALAEAKKKGCELRICVNSKSQCGQILERIFTVADVNKLRLNKPLTYQGINVFLESPVTLKKEYSSSQKWVYLLMYPSPDLLKEVERLAPEGSVIVFSEENHSEHLTAWIHRHNVNILSVE